jgi:hypothetical protein
LTVGQRQQAFPTAHFPGYTTPSTAEVDSSLDGEEDDLDVFAGNREEEQSVDTGKGRGSKLCFGAKPIKFISVVMDEAHILRSSSSKLWQMIYLLPKYTLGVITATPAWTRTGDLREVFRLI